MGSLNRWFHDVVATHLFLAALAAHLSAIRLDIKIVAAIRMPMRALIPLTGISPARVYSAGNRF
jgi:hypothetical protein